MAAVRISWCKFSRTFTVPHCVTAGVLSPFLRRVFVACAAILRRQVEDTPSSSISPCEAPLQAFQYRSAASTVLRRSALITGSRSSKCEIPVTCNYHFARNHLSIPGAFNPCLPLLGCMPFRQLVLPVVASILLLASLPFRHNHNHPSISHHIACSPRCCLLSSGHLPTNSEWHLVELYLDAAAASPLLPLCSLRCWPSAACSTRPRPSTTLTASPSRGTQTRTSRVRLADPFSTSARWVVFLHQVTSLPLAGFL